MSIRNILSMHAITRITLASLMAAGLMAAALVAGTAGLASAASASPPPQIKICLTSSRGYCVDVKDSKDTSGQAIWLYASSGAKDDHWIEVPVGCGSIGNCAAGCDMVSCISFEDAQNPSLCLASTPSQGLALLSCDLAEQGTLRAIWIKNGDNLENLFWVTQVLTTFSPLKTGGTLYVDHKGGTSGEWQRWSGPYDL